MEMIAMPTNNSITVEASPAPLKRWHHNAVIIQILIGSMFSSWHSSQENNKEMSAGVQNETCCGNKMRLVQSENFPRISGQRLSGGRGGWDTTQNWLWGW